MSWIEKYDLIGKEAFHYFGKSLIQQKRNVIFREDISVFVVVLILTKGKSFIFRLSKFD